MPAPVVPGRIWAITAIMAAFIVYGSLYPFEFSVPSHGPGPVVALLGTWDRRPGRGDFLANVLLYVPFGGFFILGLRRGFAATLLTVFAGAGLSLCMELTQYYDAGRDTEASDLYANTLGTALGALLGLAAGAGSVMSITGGAAVRPALLIFAWLLYRLYPYVPTIDLHKYWHALAPIVQTPSLSFPDLFRQTAIWLTICTLIGAATRGRRSIRLALLFGMMVFCAKVVIIGTDVRVAELAGFSVAFAIWLLALTMPARARAGVAGVVISIHVVAERLEPFRFQAEARPFGWIPFHSLMFGSLTVDTLAFLEKFFLYGSILYLLGTASGGTRRPEIAVFVALLLLTTSWLETFLPGRSAEITDTLLVLIIALTFALLPPEAAIDPLPAASR